MNPSTKCPHCGAEWEVPEKMFACGTPVMPSGLISEMLLSDLCDEREAHNKTRAELQETEEVRDSWFEAYTEARDDLEATLNENQKFRELLELALPHIHPKAIHYEMSKTNPISECYINTLINNQLSK